jgi:hypothetical protein
MTSKHSSLRYLALAFALVALAIPSAASAYPATQPAGVHYSSSLNSQPTQVASAPSSTESAFSWSDAAIGAGFAVALIAIAGGTVVLVKGMRADRTRFQVTS